MEDLSIYIAFAAPHIAAFAYIILRSRAEVAASPEPVAEDEAPVERRVSRVYFG